MDTVDIKALNERIQQESSFVDMINMEMNKVIVGQKHLVEGLLIGMLSNGHILLEGVPGLDVYKRQHNASILIVF